MTIRTNPELAAILAGANSQYSQVRALNTALTTSKRVKCKRVSDAATPQADVWANGVLFRDAALLGAFSFQGKDIVGYGKTSGLTAALAADLGTGKSVLRIEGNGHWIEGTLGLPGSGADFILPVNPTATNSIAISGSVRIKPSANLPDGTPDITAPTISLSAPSSVAIAGPVALSATVADNVAVAKVEFRREGSIIATLTSGPWTCNDTLAAANNGNVAYSAKAYDAAGNSTTSNTVVTVVDIAPPTETGPETAVGAALTTVTAETAAGAAQNNMPVTFAQVFKVGALPASGAAVDLHNGTTAVPCQLDVKATHPDGSVRHAVLSAIIPTVTTGGAQTWSIRRAAAGAAPTPPVPSDFAGLDAVVTIVETGTDLAGPNAGTTYTAQLAPLLAAGQFEAWLSGDVCSDWLVRAPLKTAGGDVHPDLHVRFNVRAYKGQARAKIDFIVENGLVKKNPSANQTWDATVGVTDRIYRASISVAGDTVYTRATKGYLYTRLENRNATNDIIEIWDDRATGLANDSTAYTATMTVDGTARDLNVTGSAAQTYGQLRALLNTQLAGSAVCTLVTGSQSLLFQSATAGVNSSVVLTTPGTLFPALDHVQPKRPIFGGEVIAYAHTSWKKTFWWGGEPAVHLRHNRAYLEDTKGVPKYQANLTGDAATITAWKNEMAAHGDILGTNGITNSYMPATGYAPGIGMLPSWAAMWLINQGPDIKKIMLQMGDLVGSWPMIYRDAGTDKPIAFENYPTATTSPNGGDSVNPATGLQEKFPPPTASPYLMPNTCIPDVSHHPDLCFAPYLATGDHFYMEGLLMQQRWLLITQNPIYREGRKGLVQSEQPRGQGWLLRTTAHAAYITPNAHPLKSELAYHLAQNLVWYTTNYVNTDGQYHNNLGVIYHGYGFAYNGGRGGSPWMDGYITAAAGRIVELGNAGYIPFLRFKSKWVVGLLTSPPPVCWQWFGQYTFNWRASNTGPLYSTFAEVWNGTFDNDPAVLSAACGTQAMATAIGKYEGGRPNTINTTAGYPDLIGGYVANAQGAVAYSATYDMPGADDAWLVYASNALKPDFNTGPQFAIIPRN